LQAVGLLLVNLVDDFVTGNGRAPASKFLTRIAPELAQIRGDGSQNLLKNVIGVRQANVSENEIFQIALYQEHNPLGQPQAVGHSACHPVGFNECDNFAHLSAKIGICIPSVQLISEF